MNFERWRMALGIIFLMGAALIQNAPWFRILNIRPNIALSALVVLIFFIRSPILFISSTFLMTAVLGNVFIFSPVFLIFGLVGIAGFFVKRLMPWADVGGSALLAAAMTLGFYGIIAPALFRLEFGIIMIEILLNAAITAGVYVLAKRMLSRTMISKPL